MTFVKMVRYEGIDAALIVYQHTQVSSLSQNWQRSRFLPCLRQSLSRDFTTYKWRHNTRVRYKRKD